jgi:hypothetical protein
LEYTSTREVARKRLVDAHWSPSDVDLDVISVPLTWAQRNCLGEDESVQKVHIGALPSTMFFHERTLCTFWRARNSGPGAKAFKGGPRRCEHWTPEERWFTTVDELDCMPVFVPKIRVRSHSNGPRAAFNRGSGEI